MDNFLRLVPTATADGDPSLIYGDEDDLITRESEAQLLDNTNSLSLTNLSSHACPSDCARLSESEALQTYQCVDARCSSAREERERFLVHLMTMDSELRRSQTDLDHRLSSLRRIGDIGDTTEQFKEYLLLLKEQDRQLAGSSALSTDPVLLNLQSQIVQHATDMSDGEDSEVALLAAYVFMADMPSRARTPISIISAAAVVQALATLN